MELVSVTMFSAPMVRRRLRSHGLRPIVRGNLGVHWRWSIVGSGIGTPWIDSWLSLRHDSLCLHRTWPIISLPMFLSLGILVGLRCPFSRLVDPLGIVEKADSLSGHSSREMAIGNIVAASLNSILNR